MAAVYFSRTTNRKAKRFRQFLPAPVLRKSKGTSTWIFRMRRRPIRRIHSERTLPKCASIAIWAKSASHVFVGAYGVGRVMNLKTATSQLHGGIIMGIGMALMEETVLDTNFGRIINQDVAEYHMPVNADIPPIEVHIVDEFDPYASPIGAKGMGEIGIVGPAAAIANAVYHATGVRVRDLPITPDKLIGKGALA